MEGCGGGFRFGGLVSNDAVLIVDANSGFPSDFMSFDRHQEQAKGASRAKSKVRACKPQAGGKGYLIRPSIWSRAGDLSSIIT